MAEPWGAAAARQERLLTPLAILLVVVLLAGLPVATWLDLRALSEQSLRQQVTDIGRVVNAVRNFYANDIVQRVLDAKGDRISVTDDYLDHPGAIPIPPGDPNYNDALWIALHTTSAFAPQTTAH